MLTTAVSRSPPILPAVPAFRHVPRLAVGDDHGLVFGLVALVVAALFLLYLWKRRRLRRERS